MAGFANRPFLARTGLGLVRKWPSQALLSVGAETAFGRSEQDLLRRAPGWPGGVPGPLQDPLQCILHQNRGPRGPGTPGTPGTPLGVIGLSASTPWVCHVRADYAFRHTFSR